MTGIWKQAAIACLCAMLAVWWWIRREAPDTQHTAYDNPPTLTVTHATAYRYDAQGALQDTLHAQRIAYYHDQRDTFFQNPVLRRETENGHLHGQSQEAHMPQNGNIHFRGNVLMQRFGPSGEELAVRSQRMDYDRSAHTLASPAEVEITDPQSRTQSTGAVWQLKRNYLILQENVRSHYDPSRPR